MKEIRASPFMYMLVAMAVKQNSGSSRRRSLRPAMVLTREPCESVRQSWSKIATLLKEHGMDTSARAVRFDDDSMWVDLSDGRVIAVPLAWFPRLLRATVPQREQVEISAMGLHWEALDEDISVAGLLAGRGDVSNKLTAAA
jgi:hypothetical protein